MSSDIFIITGIFVMTWVVALLVWRLGNIENKWELQAAQGSTRADDVLEGCAIEG